jgi:hypothetical protein
MEDGTMLVVDMANSSEIGQVLWTGSLRDGSWTFSADPELDDVTRKRWEKTISRLPESNEWLKGQSFRGVDGRQYRGWHGFEGVMGALEKSLPSIGVQVDRSASRWPPYKKTGTPKDIDSQALEEQKKEWSDYDQADAATELVAFLERNSGDGI